MNKISLAVIGCGGRGQAYCELASTMPHLYDVVAAADPNPVRVDRIAAYAGGEKNTTFQKFASDKEILAVDKLADVMIIGTQDSMHREHCIAALEKGYDVMLEKPIANNLADVLAVKEKAEELGRKVLICHVMRYSPFYVKVKEVIDSGVLGDIITVNA
ncbi:MAG: Gfo/Idh/MocA family oxidoreductase, partial [Planctomycetes bacterium]|nr:Gfo/Idh/MocA family oxidoreductase [Planctomycetota bacterium]